MSDELYEKDGEQYIFPPDQIAKPSKNTETNIIWENGETQ